MKIRLLILVCVSLMSISVLSQNIDLPLRSHPDSKSWEELYKADLSNAYFPEGIWSYSDGILTAIEDQCIWTKKDYDNFVVDVEFKTVEGTNSGVIVYCSNTDW